jgi:membrane protein required for colicin V production
MNLLDLGIIAILFLVTLRGYFRGLFQELAVLVGLVGGLLVASHTYLALAALILPLINSLFWAQGLAFAVVLVVVYWCVRALAYILQRLLYHLYLDVLDRLLGAFFAFLKGCLILGLALLLLGVVLPKNSNLIKESRAHPLLIQLAKRTLDLLPPDFKQRAKDYLRSVPLPGEKKQTRDEERTSSATFDGRFPKQVCSQSGPDQSRTPDTEPAPRLIT